MPEMTTKHLAVSLVVSAIFLSSCDGIKIEEPEPYVTDQRDRIRQRSGTIHGNDKGFVIYSNRDEAAEQRTDQAQGNGKTPARAREPASGGSIGANPYLWLATLESLDFLPLAQADSSGGVIISDWYAPPETPNERFKVMVYILDPALRADALKVSVFRQTNGDGGWVDAAVDKATAAGLEDNILKRARELRLAGSG